MQVASVSAQPILHVIFVEETIIMDTAKFLEVLKKQRSIMWGTKDVSNSPTTLFSILLIKGGNRTMLILVESKMEHQVVDPTNESTHCCMSELTRWTKACNNFCNYPSRTKKIQMHP